MLIGTLQPEEFARGNFGRFRVLNGFRGKDGAHQALRALASEGVRETPVATFARLHRVPLRDVLAKHTVLPFAAFSVVSEDDEDGAFWHRRTIATYGFGIVRAHAYCCLDASPKTVCWVTAIGVFITNYPGPTIARFTVAACTALLVALQHLTYSRPRR